MSATGPQGPTNNPQPIDLGAARRERQWIRRERDEANKAWKVAIAATAAAEARYQQVLAKEMLIAKAAQGATVAKEIAKGTSAVLDALTEFRIAKGMEDFRKSQVAFIESERATLHREMDWAIRLSPDGQYGVPF